MARKPHPPKKKHANRPRPPAIEPLTDSARREKAQREFDKAITHLIEAERLAQWGQAPNACVHSAYYAMHHSACAALLASGGVGKYLDAPKSHEHVIQHYGNLIANESEPLKSTGLSLSRARTDRMVADYDLVSSADNEDAQHTVSSARAMIDAILARWNFNDNITQEFGRD